MEQLPLDVQDKLKAWIEAASSGCHAKTLFYSLLKTSTLEWAYKTFRALPGNNSFWIEQINRLLRENNISV